MWLLEIFMPFYMKHITFSIKTFKLLFMSSNDSSKWIISGMKSREKFRVITCLTYNFLLLQPVYSVIVNKDFTVKTIYCSIFSFEHRSLILRKNLNKLDTIRHDTGRHNTKRYITIQHNTMKNEATQYNTLQYDTIRYDTKKHIIQRVAALSLAIKFDA